MNTVTSAINNIISEDIAILLQKIEDDKPKWLLCCNKKCEEQIKEMINKSEFKQYKITIMSSNHIDEDKIFLIPDNRDEQPIKVRFE